MCDKQRVHDHKNKCMQTQTSPPSRSPQIFAIFVSMRVRSEVSSSVKHRWKTQEYNFVNEIHLKIFEDLKQPENEMQCRRGEWKCQAEI